MKQSVILPLYSKTCLKRPLKKKTKKRFSKIVGEYDQEIPQSQTTDNPNAPQGRAAQPSRDRRKTNQAKQPALSPHQDDCNTRMDTKQCTTKHRTITDSHNGSNNEKKSISSAY